MLRWRGAVSGCASAGATRAFRSCAVSKSEISSVQCWLKRQCVWRSPGLPSIEPAAMSAHESASAWVFVAHVVYGRSMEELQSEVYYKRSELALWLFQLRLEHVGHKLSLAHLQVINFLSGTVIDFFGRVASEVRSRLPRARLRLCRRNRRTTPRSRPCSTKRLRRSSIWSTRGRWAARLGRIGRNDVSFGCVRKANESERALRNAGMRRGLVSLGSDAAVCSSDPEIRH